VSAARANHQGSLLNKQTLSDGTRDCQQRRARIICVARTFWNTVLMQWTGHMHHHADMMPR
jgi:hypothetical protein